jgi:chromosome segregation ATPase
VEAVMARKLSREEALTRQLIALNKNLASEELNAQASIKPTSQTVYLGQLERDYPELLLNPSSRAVPPAVSLAYRNTRSSVQASKLRGQGSLAEVARIKAQIDAVELELKSINPKYTSRADIENQKRKDAVDVTKIISDAEAGKASIQAEIKKTEMQLAAAKGRREEINRDTSFLGSRTKTVQLANNNKEILSLERGLGRLNEDLKFFDQRNKTKEKTLNANLYTAMMAGDTAKVDAIKADMKANEAYNQALSTAFNNGNYTPGYAYGPSKSGYQPIVIRGGARRGTPGPLR